jgi:hypothetical protein
MKIRINSDEYKCWHEVGHAVVCLDGGGDVECMEFLDDKHAPARTRCVFTSLELEKTVACGGFAAEFFLLKNGYVDKLSYDERAVNRIVFHNAIQDREDYLGRKRGEAIAEAEDREFMHRAIGSDGHGGVLPIFSLYLPGMRELVRELLAARRVEGWRVKELLRRSIPR